MRRMGIVALATMAACSTGGATTTTSAVVVPERLVVLDAQGTLTTMNPDGTGVVTLVDGSDRVVLQPTWSPRGERLAWVEVVLAGGPDDVAVVTARADGSGKTRSPVSSPPFYLSWDPTGERLVLLRNGVLELEAGLIDVTVAEPSEDVIGSGQPFYFAWDPTGTEILAHVGVRDRLGILGLDGAESSFGMAPGHFQAPGWVGDRVFWVRDDDGGQSLVASGVNGGDAEVLATTTDFLHFVVSPDGRWVAYRELDLEAPAVTVALRAQSAVGELIVLDVESGDAATVDTANPLAFFWSPDSSKLLFLSADGDGFTWRVWDGAAVASYETFAPSRTLGRDYLPFFDQYAHSIELWSPDGESFVYAGRGPGRDRSQIWLQPLDGNARPVADGVFAAFAPDS